MNNKAKIYHGQASIDKYAKKDDIKSEIAMVSLKQIKESYKEFLDDLMIESQEAY